MTAIEPKTIHLSFITYHILGVVQKMKVTAPEPSVRLVIPFPELKKLSFIPSRIKNAFFLAIAGLCLSTVHFLSERAIRFTADVFVFISGLS